MDRQPQTDPDTTAVRPALADDLLEPTPYADDDLLADEEFMAPGGARPSRLTRVLLALLLLAVGVLVGAQLAKVAGTSANASGAAAGQSRRFGASGTGTASGRPSAGTFAGASAPAAQGEVSSVRAHTLVVQDAGAGRTVTFTDATPVTEPYGHGKLAAGVSVGGW